MHKKDTNRHNNLVLSAGQAAKILSVSIVTLKKFIYKGIIKAWKTPDGHYNIRKKDLFLVSGPDLLPEQLSISSNKTLLTILGEFINTLETRQRFCCKHSKIVAKVSIAIAQRLNFSARDIHRLYLAALLHDIGMIKININIINKPTPLTDKEYSIIKTHPSIGADIIAAYSQIKGLADIVRQHHERYDGIGYPDKLAKNKICPEARIVALADAFACMTAKDSYKRPLSNQEALEEIKINISRQFDPQIAKIFLSLNTQSSPK